MERKYLFKFILFVFFLFSLFCFSQLKKDTIEEKKIEEIVISTIKKGITTQGDKITMNIDDNPLYSNLTVKEVLEFMPKVSIDDGKIKVVGKKKVLVLIDGRESSLRMDAIPVQQVKKIELMSNASAKYDAKYDAVINVILDKWKNQGISGNVLLNTTIADEMVSNNGAGALSYNKGKFSTRMNYSFNHENKLLKEYEFQEMMDYDYTLEDKRVASWKGNYIGISSDVEIGEHQNIGVDVGYTNSYKEISGDVYQILYPKNNTASSVITSNRLQNGLQNDFYGSLYHKLKKERLSLDSYLYFYHTKNNANDDFDSFSGGNNVLYIRNRNNNAFRNYIANVSGEYRFKDESVLSFGLRAVNSLGKFKQDINIDTVHLLFDFDEKVYAQYVEWNKKIKRFDVKIGNRLEYFTREVQLNAEPKQIQNQWDLFPSVYLGYRLSDKHSLSLSGVRKIDRVAFKKILPYSYRTSFNEVMEGNPHLKNQIQYNVELSYIFDNSLFLTPFYNYYKNTIEDINFIDGNTVRYIPQNYDYYTFGANFTYVKYLKKWWYMNATLNVQKNHNQGIILGTPFSNNNIEYTPVLTNMFTFNKWGSFIIQNSYNSPMYYDFYKISQGFKMDFKYTNKLMDNQLVVSFTVRDILGTYYNRIESVREGYRSSSDKHYAWQQFILGISYNFGKGKKTKNIEKNINSSENIRLKN